MVLLSSSPCTGKRGYLPEQHPGGKTFLVAPVDSRDSPDWTNWDPCQSLTQALALRWWDLLVASTTLPGGFMSVREGEAALRQDAGVLGKCQVYVVHDPVGPPSVTFSPGEHFIPVSKDVCLRMFMEAVLRIAKNCNWPKCLSTTEQLNKYNFSPNNRILYSGFVNLYYCLGNIFQTWC